MSKEELYNIVFDTPELKEYVENKDKEIERLNNIINELEKWLKQQYGLDKEEWEYSSPYIWHEHITLEFVLNKLQELKGSDKE